MLIQRPGGGLDPLGVVFALTNVCLATAYRLLTRLLTKTKNQAALLFHAAIVGTVIFGTVIFGALALSDLPQALPPLPDLGLMGLLGGKPTPRAVWMVWRLMGY
jgi:hypothetical protein